MYLIHNFSVQVDINLGTSTRVIHWLLVTAGSGNGLMSSGRCHANISSQWRHVSILQSPITGSATVFQHLVRTNNNENIKASHRLSVVNGIHRWLADSPDKRPATQREFLCYDSIVWKRLKILRKISWNNLWRFRWVVVYVRSIYHQ